MIPLIDNHGHSLLLKFREAKEADFAATFSESRFAGQMTADIEGSIFFMDMMKKLFALSGATTLAQYLKMRAGSSAFARGLMKDLFSKAGIERVILDDGFAAGAVMSNSEFESATGIKVSRVVRVEPVLESLIAEHAEPASVESALENALLPARDKSIVGMKTIACYRGGLSLNEVDEEDALANFADCRRSILSGGRIKKSSYYYYILLKAFDLARERDLPVQVHCGMGDDDADLNLSNPDLLQRLLRKPRFSQLKLVLLHCYPFHRQAAILASLYPGVHFDLSLASFLLVDQAALYREALAGAPITKLLAGTDGHSQPETYYQGATALRQGISDTLLSFEESGSITRDEAAEIEKAILNGNARRLYKLR